MQNAARTQRPLFYRKQFVKEPAQAIVVRFPLSGEWCALNTPGHKIPSHGTDRLGMRYAYDFFQIDWEQKGYKYFKAPVLQSMIFGVTLEDTYCWAQPIYAPFDAEVIEVMDGLKERNPVHMLKEFLLVLKNEFFKAKATSNRGLHPVLGNFIILKKAEGVYALIAHARTGSIQVSEGQSITEGQEIAQVGHSGNSTAPHLHFQLMDNPDLLSANGLPCCFKHYQLYNDGHWEAVSLGVPGKRERIIA